MKIFLLAVLLTIMQTGPPVPRKTADDEAGQSAKHQNQTNQKQADSAITPSPSISVSQLNDTPQGDTKATPASPCNAEKTVNVAKLPTVTVRTDGWYIAYVIFTGILVGVGGAGIFYAIKTLKAIERQAKANEDQLTEIQQSAEKTDRMISLTAQQAENSRIAAEAAKASADALISIERAWVMAELRCRPDTSITTHTSIYQGITSLTTTVSKIELHCVNDGNSPAWITEKSARLVVVKQGELPKFPELSSADILPDELEPMGPGKDNAFIWDANGQGTHSTKTATLIYGVVRYTDIFKNKRETWFCYQLTGYKTNREMIRITGEPEYNKNT